MKAYIQRNLPAYIQLIKTLTAIPAPSHKEQQKAEYIRQWMADLAARTGFPLNIFIDDATNVVCECFADPDPAQVTLFLAHTDTVFPDEQPIEVLEDDRVIAAPGVGDDTTNVAAMMMGIQYLAEQQLRPQQNVVFVFNSCEEGLGNLKGCRAVMERYAGKVCEFISFDGGYSELVDTAVGSERFRICIKTEGGHSFSSFGNRNAIAVMAELIHRLYQIDAGAYPGRTTYNVGIIEGGTSVNTIAQQAEMLFEYRSDRKQSLQGIQAECAAIFQEFSEKYDMTTELLGSRPSMGEVDPKAMDQLINEVSLITQQVTGIWPKRESSSTDCNIPLSLGIPATCIGAYAGKGAHTREEYVLKDSLPAGLEILIRILLRKF